MSAANTPAKNETEEARVRVLTLTGSQNPEVLARLCKVLQLDDTQATQNVMSHVLRLPNVDAMTAFMGELAHVQSEYANQVNHDDKPFVFTTPERNGASNAPNYDIPVGVGLNATPSLPPRKEKGKGKHEIVLAPTEEEVVAAHQRGDTVPGVAWSEAESALRGLTNAPNEAGPAGPVKLERADARRKRIMPGKVPDALRSLFERTKTIGDVATKDLYEDLVPMFPAATPIECDPAPVDLSAQSTTLLSSLVVLRDLGRVNLRGAEDLGHLKPNVFTASFGSFARYAAQFAEGRKTMGVVCYVMPDVDPDAACRHSLFLEISMYDQGTPGCVLGTTYVYVLVQSKMYCLGQVSLMRAWARRIHESSVQHPLYVAATTPFPGSNAAPGPAVNAEKTFLSFPKREKPKRPEDTQPIIVPVEPRPGRRREASPSPSPSSSSSDSEDERRRRSRRHKEKKDKHKSRDHSRHRTHSPRGAPAATQPKTDKPAKQSKVPTLSLPPPSGGYMPSARALAYSDTSNMLAKGNRK